MDGPKAPPGGFSDHGATPATATPLVQLWRRNGGHSGNVFGNGNGNGAAAVSHHQQPREEMAVPSAAADSASASARQPWNPPSPNICPGRVQGGTEHADVSNSSDGSVLGTGNLPRPPSDPLPVASTRPLSRRMIPNYVAVAPPGTSADVGSGPSSSSSSSVTLTNNEDATSGYREEVLRQLLILMARSSRAMERDERVMNRGESALLLRLLNESSHAETIDDVVRVVYDRNVYCTMADEFGSQVFVALLDACNGRQMEALVRIATWNGVLLTMVAGKSKFGCNCIKKLVEKVKTSPGFSRRVVDALAEGANYLMTADYGREVLKHCFRHLRYDRTCVLVNAAAQGLMEYATDVRGCGSLKYIISQARDSLRRWMIITVGLNALNLATHCYGNYVVQHVLDAEDSEDVKEFIFLTMAVNFVQVAKNKSGSFVLEKFLNSPLYGLYLCSVIACYSRDLPEGLEQVARDRHGNYVLQRALEVATAAPNIHLFLVRAIAQLPRSLMTDPYANKLYKTALRDLGSRQ